MLGFAALAAPELGWDSEMRNRQIAAVDDFYRIDDDRTATSP